MGAIRFSYCKNSLFMSIMILRNQGEIDTMLEVRLLNYFLVVAREQNMTRAAAELHISQPALSAQIADLERQLGIKLFKRTNKSTLLTEDGILFRARAQELIELTNKIESEFASGNGDISGDIYLGCGETCIMSYISSVFREIQKEYPDIHLHIYSGDSDAVIDRLDKGLLDIGLLLGPVFHEKYDYQGLGMYDSFGLLVPADSALAPKDSISLDELKKLPVLVPYQVSSGAHNLGGFPVGALNVVGNYNLITNVTYMVEQGIGYAFCLANLVNTQGRNLKFIPLAQEVKIEAYLVTKKYAYFSKPAKLLLKRLGENLR